MLPLVNDLVTYFLLFLVRYHVIIMMHASTGTGQVKKCVNEEIHCTTCLERFRIDSCTRCRRKGEIVQRPMTAVRFRKYGISGPRPLLDLP